MTLTLQQKYMIGGGVLLAMIGYAWWSHKKTATLAAHPIPAGSLPTGTVPGSGLGGSGPGGGPPGSILPNTLGYAYAPLLPSSPSSNQNVVNGWWGG